MVGDKITALGHPEYTAVKPQLPVKLGGLYVERNKFTINGA